MRTKIIHLNHNISESSVPLRLVEALELIGVDSTIVTMISKVDNKVFVVSGDIIFKIRRRLKHFSMNGRLERRTTMPFSSGDIGIPLLSERLVADADIIVLHWIWGHFVSLAEIKKMLVAGKRIIIVCHDNAHFTGGCHVRMGCDKYMTGCGVCPQLHSSRKNDITHKQINKKIELYKDANVVIVSPSRWMDNNVANSMVFQGKAHCIIPNPINTDFFAPKDTTHEQNTRNVRILFGAVNATKTPYKGFKELLEALSIFMSRYGERYRVEADVFGADNGIELSDDGIHINYLGNLKQKQMVEAYNNADIYVVPSLEDSFNNTVAEALSCQTPVVAFATGGIVDIIDHKENGYLAEYKSAEDLADGIFWVLNNNADNVLGKAGRYKVIKYFSYSVVAEKYNEIFQSFYND